jgi:hypothetical protein
VIADFETFEPAQMRFVIDVFDHGLVVIPLDEARRLAVLEDALEVSSTWGDFLQSVAGDSATLAYLADQYGEDLPSGTEVFDADELPGFADGSWPTFPKHAMLEWLPPSATKLGTIRPTAFAGEYLHIDAQRQPEVMRALAAAGYECQEADDDLVSRACGAWRYS